MLLTGSPPFFGTDDEVFQKIKSAEVCWSSRFRKLSDSAKDFLRALFTPDPTFRPSAQEALDHPWSQYTQGLTDLDVRCKRYYEAGARFAKWRAVLSIQNNQISEASIKETAWTLARYAAICQDNGLCPIIEPEILMDGDHSP